MPWKMIWVLLWISILYPYASYSGEERMGKLYSFGDSGIDTGNVLAVTGGLEPAVPYWEGRFSNGPNYLDTLAGAVPGWEAVPWAYGGTNAAFGGAQSGLGYAGVGVPNAGEQVLQFQQEYGGIYAPSDMILFSMGQNDLLFSGDAPPDPADVAGHMVEAFNFAYDNGARRFIFPSLFPLHLMPGLVGDESVDLEYVEAWVNGVNAAADALIAGFKADRPDAVVIRTDLTERIGKVYADPGAYGITNVTDSAYTGDFFGEGGSVAQGAASYLWWDEAHVTARVQELVAKWILFDVQNGLFPEESSPMAGLGSLLTLADQSFHRNLQESGRVFELLQASAPSPDRGGGWYLTPSGGVGDEDGEVGLSGWSWHYAGLTLGREARLPGGAAAGFSLGSSRGDLSLDNGAGDSDLRVYEAGLYGGVKDRLFFMLLGGRYGYADNRAFRNLTLTETTALNRFHTHLFSGWTEAGLCLEAAGVMISPLAGLAYVRMVSSTGSESSGGILGYDTVDYASAHHLRHQLGVRLSRAIAFENGLKGKWSAGVAWHHDYLDRGSQVNVSHGGEVYPFSSPCRPRDSLGFSAGLDLSRGGRCSLRLDYDGVWSGASLAQWATLSLVLAYY